MITLSEKTTKSIQESLKRYPTKQAAILPVLWAVQDERGYIGQEEVKYVSEVVGVSEAHVHGVITFYTMFKRPDEGKHIVWVCRTLPCALRGSDKLFKHISAKLGVKNNGTTADKKFTLKNAECLADCDKAPVIQIDNRTFRNVTSESFDRIIVEFRG